MKLGWKEIWYNRKKYFLIELTIVLLIFMVLFLSGLANGLARAVSAAIENTSNVKFILSEDSQSLITASRIDEKQYKVLKEEGNYLITPLNIQRSYVTKEGENKLDIMYFAIDPKGFLQPSIIKGKELEHTENSIILDDAYMEEGISIGDVIIDNTSNVEMTVVGFTKDAMYGHISVGYLSFDTFHKMKTVSNPNYQVFYQTLALAGEENGFNTIPGLEVKEKMDIVEHIPGYSAEQTTIRMILWVLVSISGAILGVFFYIITIQKEKQFGVMKAVGMKISEIIQIIIFQILFLAGFGVVLGNILVFLMANNLPAAMPFYLKYTDVILVCVAFIFISVICGMLSTLRVAKVDPLITIGGNEN